MEFHENRYDMKVCFIGHRTIKRTEKLFTLLEETIISLINKGAKTFLFGSRSDFDHLAREVVTRLKEKYPKIKRVYVRAEYKYVNSTYENYLLNFYDETYFPQKLENAGRYSYVERNYEMVDQSAYCVFYYNENYVLPMTQSKSSMLRRNSGTKIAYEYAIKKKKQIINLFVGE